MLFKMTAIILLSLTISSCAWLFPEPEVRIVTEQVHIPIAQPVYPRAIDLKEPQWYVVSAENIDEFLENITKEAGVLVFFAMTPADYELMAYNMQEIRRYVLEMNEVILYYRDATILNEDE